MDMNEAISMFEPFFVGLIVLLAAGLPHRRRAGRNTVRQKGEGAQAKAFCRPGKGTGAQPK